MRLVPGGPNEVRRLLRAHADEQAALLVPRPGYPIYGLAAPALRFAWVSEFLSYNGQWTSVTLSYGDPDAQDGPRVTVTTSACDADFMVASSQERRPDAVTRRDVENVTVTVATWEVPADAVRTGPVPDLRPLIEGALADRIARIERRQREPRPPQPPPRISRPPRAPRRCARWPTSPWPPTGEAASPRGAGQGYGTRSTGAGCTARCGSGRSANGGESPGPAPRRLTGT